MRNYFACNTFSRFMLVVAGWIWLSAVRRERKSRAAKLWESWGDDWIEFWWGPETRRDHRSHKCNWMLIPSFSLSSRMFISLTQFQTHHEDCYWIRCAFVLLYSLSSLSLLLAARDAAQSHLIAYSRRLHLSSQALYCCWSSPRRTLQCAAAAEPWI